MGDRDASIVPRRLAGFRQAEQADRGGPDDRQGDALLALEGGVPHEQAADAAAGAGEVLREKGSNFTSIAVKRLLRADKERAIRWVPSLVALCMLLLYSIRVTFLTHKLAPKSLPNFVTVAPDHHNRSLPTTFVFVCRSAPVQQKRIKTTTQQSSRVKPAAQPRRLPPCRAF